MPLQLRRALGVAEHDQLAAARRRLLQIGRGLLEQRAGRRDRDHRHAAVDQRDRAVLHLAGGIALGVDVADLLQLQRAFQRDREAGAAAEIQHVARLGDAGGERAGCARRAPAPRRRGPAPPAARPSPPLPAAALSVPRARPAASAKQASTASCAVNALVLATPISGPATVSSTASLSRAMLLSGTFSTDSVGHALLAHVAQRRQRVGGLARLADQQAQRAGFHRRRAVAEFARHVGVGRDARQRLQPPARRPARHRTPSRRR